MEIVVGIIIGLAIGFFVGKLMEAKSAGEEKTQLIAKAQVLAANIEQIKLHHASEVQSLKQSHASEVQSMKSQMEKTSGCVCGKIRRKVNFSKKGTETRESEAGNAANDDRTAEKAAG